MDVAGQLCFASHHLAVGLADELVSLCSSDSKSLKQLPEKSTTAAVICSGASSWQRYRTTFKKNLDLVLGTSVCVLTKHVEQLHIL